LKASIPGVQATFNQLHDIPHFGPFIAASIYLKKPQEAAKELITQSYRLKSMALRVLNIRILARSQLDM
jgi:hypothetical protein